MLKLKLCKCMQKFVTILMLYITKCKWKKRAQKVTTPAVKVYFSKNAFPRNVYISPISFTHPKMEWFQSLFSCKSNFVLCQKIVCHFVIFQYNLTLILEGFWMLLEWGLIVPASRNKLTLFFVRGNQYGLSWRSQWCKTLEYKSPLRHLKLLVGWWWWSCVIIV